MISHPSIQIDAIHTIRNDGVHNAFTDLCRFNDQYYLTFRSCPDGHMVFATSKIVVLQSHDAKGWREVFCFSVSDRDTRDPHFLIFNDTLFVFSGTWLVPPEGVRRDLNDHLGFGVWSEDGENWSGPILLEGTYGHYIWRAASHGDMAYICGRRRRKFRAGVEEEKDPEEIEGCMLESEDGLVWRFRGFFAEEYGDETAFLFEEDGSVLAIVRDGAGERSRVCRSSPPFEEWTRTHLDLSVGGPLIARWGDRCLVAGRKIVNRVATTTLFWLIDDQLHEAAELPSGGDNSYPGFVALDDTHALLSYYSSHEGNASIYLAELSIFS